MSSAVIALFSCYYCMKQFKTRQNRQEHENGHTGNKTVCCPACPAKFSNSYFLRKHNIVHYSDIDTKMLSAEYKPDVINWETRRSEHFEKPEIKQENYDAWTEFEETKPIPMNSNQDNNQNSHHDSKSQIEAQQSFPNCDSDDDNKMLIVFTRDFKPLKKKSPRKRRKRVTTYDFVPFNSKSLGCSSNRSPKKFKCPSCPKRYVKEISLEQHLDRCENKINTKRSAKLDDESKKEIHIVDECNTADNDTTSVYSEELGFPDNKPNEIRIPPISKIKQVYVSSIWLKPIDAASNQITDDDELSILETRNELSEEVIPEDARVIHEPKVIDKVAKYEFLSEINFKLESSRKIEDDLVSSCSMETFISFEENDDMPSFEVAPTYQGSIQNFEEFHEQSIKIEMEDRDYIIKCTVVSSSSESNSGISNSKDSDSNDYNLHDEDQYSMASTSRQKHPCHMCEKTFKSQMLLNRHIRNHEDIRPFGCDQCEKMFKTKTYLKEHQRSHSGERPFECAECPATFKTHSQLRLHKYVHINASRAGKLPKVNNVGDQLSSSESEEDEEVRKNRRFPCQVEGCDKAFRFATHRKTHMIVHQEDRPFKCDQCDKSFKSSACLASHSICHLEPTITCERCDRKFLTEDYLKRHIDIHIGEPPIMCRRCKEPFETEYLLKRHMDMHVARDVAKSLKKKRIRRPRRVSKNREQPDKTQPDQEKEPLEKRVKIEPEEEQPVIAMTVPEDREPVSTILQELPSTSKVPQATILQPNGGDAVPEQNNPAPTEVLQENRPLPAEQISSDQLPSTSFSLIEAKLPQPVIATIVSENSQLVSTGFPSSTQPVADGPEPLTSQPTALIVPTQQEDRLPLIQGAQGVPQMPLQAVNQQMAAAQWQQYCYMMWKNSNIPHVNYYYNPYPIYDPYRPNLHMFPAPPAHPGMVLKKPPNNNQRKRYNLVRFSKVQKLNRNLVQLKNDVNLYQLAQINYVSRLDLTLFYNI